MKRPEVLTGPTYHATYPTQDGKEHDVWVTVNDLDGKPFEVFVRLDVPEYFEWVTAMTLMITRALRAGESLEAVADELREIASPASRHYLPGGRGECPSLAARIGDMLKKHAEGSRA